jgi:hypothetical protein
VIEFCKHYKTSTQRKKLLTKMPEKMEGFCFVLPMRRGQLGVMLEIKVKVKR